MSHDVLEAARDVYPLVREAADEIEALGRLPDRVADAMAEAGLFALLTPPHYGGAGVDPVTSLQAVEIIGRADASAGWLALNCTFEAGVLGWLRPETVAEMLSISGDLRVVGSAPTQGFAVATEGGYRLWATWDFVSGIRNANWVLGGCVLLDRPGGAPILGPDGLPLRRIMFMQPHEGEVQERWDVMGMRGTGSHDFHVDDVFVPAERSMWWSERAAVESPVFRGPDFPTWAWAGHGGNALGIARAAIEAVVEHRDQGSKFSASPLHERPQVHQALGEADAIVRAARAFLLEAMTECWEGAVAGVADLDRLHWRARQAITHAVREAERAVSVLYPSVGTNAIRTEFGLERRARDLRVAILHGAVMTAHYQAAGQAMLGRAPDINTRR